MRPPNNKARYQRYFPTPWTVEDVGAAFVVKDSNGQKLGYFCYKEEPGRRSAAKLLSKDKVLVAIRRIRRRSHWHVSYFSHVRHPRGNTMAFAVVE